ncbi:MAG: PD40 domain-containing protein [Acidobacteriaceae bacterium]|nr:PD40 domain-containing protein [Acidobacteriaceae bacterium]
MSSHARLEPLPISSDNAGALAISRDGKRLVYTRESRNANIWAVDVPTGQTGTHATAAPRPFIVSSRSAANPSFSPDGQKVAFQTGRSGWSEVWLADRDGSHARQLTDVKGTEAGFPNWSPDGTRILFHSTKQSAARLFVVDVATARAHPLPYDAISDFMPSWSRDGRCIYFASRRTGNWQIWKAPAEGGRATQVTKNGGGRPLESAGGKFLFYMKLNNGLWRMPLSGGEEQQVLVEPMGGLVAPYALGRNKVYFVRKDRQSIAVLNLANGKITAIAHTPRPVGLGLSVSPDERLLLYSQLDHVSSELMLVENFSERN